MLLYELDRCKFVIGGYLKLVLIDNYLPEALVVSAGPAGLAVHVFHAAAALEPALCHLLALKSSNVDYSAILHY